jgi:hypothetical protein
MCLRIFPTRLFSERFHILRRPHTHEVTLTKDNDSDIPTKEFACHVTDLHDGHHLRVGPPADVLMRSEKQCHHRVR